MNQIVNFLEKAQRQKLKIMNALIATREAKAKDVNRIMADPSTYASKLLEKARELTKKAAEAGLIDVTPEATSEEPKENELPVQQ
jgi:membrane-bound ClpP family serine protease